MNGTETAQNAHLLDIADDRRDVESLQLGVDGVQAAHEVLEEQLERLRQADELAAVHAERGDASAAVVDQAARVVLRVAGDGRRRVAGGRRESRGAERHLLGSLVEQERAVVRGGGGGGVERDRRRRSEAGRPVERGAGGQRRQVVARDAEPERQRSVHDRRHPNNQPPTLGRPVTRCRVDERENVPLQQHPRSKSTDSIECSLSRLRTRSLGAAATATVPLQQTVVGTARHSDELSRCGETSARVATHRQPSYLVLRAPRSRQSDSAGRPLRSSAKAGPSRRPRLPSSLARRRRPALLNLLSTCVRLGQHCFRLRPSTQPCRCTLLVARRTRSTSSVVSYLVLSDSFECTGTIERNSSIYLSKFYPSSDSWGKGWGINYDVRTQTISAVILLQIYTHISRALAAPIKYSVNIRTNDL